MLSPKTVRNHVSNIFSKLQVTDRAQAIVRACVRARRESAGCTVWSADKRYRSRLAFAIMIAQDDLQLSAMGSGTMIAG